MIEKLLIFGDLHAPYHHRPAVKLLEQLGKKWKPDHLICLGDLADFYAVSSHSKSPDRRHALQWEVAQVLEVLDRLDAIPTTKTKRFLEGNHEDRFSRYVADKAPELFGLVNTPQLLQLRDRGWKFTPYRKYDQIGKLYLTHDLGFVGRYAIQRTLDAIQHSIVTGHTHRLSYIVESNVLEQPKVAASFGWLGDVSDIDYMHAAKAKKDWALGLGIGYHDTKSGLVQLTPIPILKKGKVWTCMAEGVVYDAA